MANLTVAAFYTRSGGDIAATGLALGDIDFYLTALNRATGVDTVIWTAVNPTEEIDNVGAYTRIYATADFDTNQYFARAQYTGAVVLDQDAVQGAGVGGAWDYDTRTLSMSAVAVVSAVDGDDIAILRGDTFSATITGLGNITTRTNLWFSVKVQHSDADSASIVQIDENTGLLFLNGAVAAVAGNGSIVVNNAITGSITITLAAAETDDLRPQALQYDIQMATLTAVTTLSEGGARVVADITRSIA